MSEQDWGLNEGVLYVGYGLGECYIGVGVLGSPSDENWVISNGFVGG